MDSFLTPKDSPVVCHQDTLIQRCGLKNKSGVDKFFNQLQGVLYT